MPSPIQICSAEPKLGSTKHGLRTLAMDVVTQTRSQCPLHLLPWEQRLRQRPLWSLSQCQPSRKSNCTSLASGLYELHWLTIMPLGWYESHQVSILIPAEFGTLGTKLHLSVKSNIQSKGQKLTLAYPPNWFSAWSVDWNRLSSKVNSSYHHAFKACLPITKAGQPIGGQRKPRNSLRDDIWWTMEPRSPHIIYP